MTSIPNNDTKSRRARNRARTRHALSQAALELAAERGFAATSIDEIADRAGVSPRTFFRHFEAKEDVLIPFDPIGVPAQSIIDQPLAVPDLSAIFTAFREITPEIEGLFDRLLMLRSALSSSASLRGRDFDQRANAEDLFAQALAVRRGLDAPDSRCATAATVGLVVIRRAIDTWLDEPAGTPIGPVLDARIDEFVTLTTYLHPQ